MVRSIIILLFIYLFIKLLKVKYYNYFSNIKTNNKQSKLDIIDAEYEDLE